MVIHSILFNETLVESGENQRWPACLENVLDINSCCQMISKQTLKFYIEIHCVQLKLTTEAKLGQISISYHISWSPKMYIYSLLSSFVTRQLGKKSNSLVHESIYVQQDRHRMHTKQLTNIEKT